MIRLWIQAGVMFFAIGSALIACKPKASGNLKGYEGEETEEYSDDPNEQLPSGEPGVMGSENSADLTLVQNSCYQSISNPADRCPAQLEAAKTNRTWTDYYNNLVPWGTSQPSYIGAGAGYDTPHSSYANGDVRDRVTEQEYLNRCVNVAQARYRCEFLQCMIRKVPENQRQSFQDESLQRRCGRV